MGWVVNTTPRPLYPPGKTRYPLYRRLGGPHGRSDGCEKFYPPPGFDALKWGVAFIRPLFAKLKIKRTLPVPNFIQDGRKISIVQQTITPLKYGFSLYWFSWNSPTAQQHYSETQTPNFTLIGQSVCKERQAIQLYLSVNYCWCRVDFHEIQRSLDDWLRTPIANFTKILATLWPLIRGHRRTDVVST